MIKWITYVVCIVIIMLLIESNRSNLVYLLRHFVNDIVLRG